MAMAAGTVSGMGEVFDPYRPAKPPAPVAEAAAKVRPRLEAENGRAALQMARELGLPVVAWVGCHPKDSAGADAFFLELDDARHVVLDDVAAGRSYGPRVVYVNKDGGPAWVPAGKLSSSTARGVRASWRPHRPPD